MANTKSAAKRTRQTISRTTRNSSILTGAKGQQKRLRTAIASGNKQAATSEFQKLASMWDKAAKRGVIHANASDRRKSLFSKALAKLS
ncbi:MAG TPA: 30S ribosomal protein S20 [Chthoniobacterales bacterium]